ncbi:MAG: DUF885 domain-containing protein [Candidatus Limnocylindrales bacterium]
MTDPTRGAVDALAGRFWEGFLERQPFVATFIGDDRYDDRLEDPGLEGRAREVAALEDVLLRGAAIERPGLAVEDAITLDMLEVVARINLRAHRQGLWQLASVDQYGGPHNLFGELARVQRVDGPDRLTALLARMAAYPAYIDAHIGVLHDGAASGMTAAAPAVRRVIDQLERNLAEPLDAAPLLAAHPELAEADRLRLRAALERDIRPSQQRFLEAMRWYAAFARPGDGLWAVPDGDAAYATTIEANTTLSESPEAIHRYGLEMNEAIDAERLQIARAAGFTTSAAYRAALSADPANRAPDGAAIVALCEGQVERAVAASQRAFGRLPRAACVVRPVEAFMAAEAPPAFYVQPRRDGTRPGTFFVNTFEPGSRPLHRFAATTFHEAVPGHHFQIARETELEGLHPFRTFGSRLAGVAYTEGWGLYSERLADELGLYRDEAERFGMLDAQAWRASRLVVDTGLHALRWDRQRSVDYLAQQAGLPRLEAETETDRYLNMPGQALAYMLGQRAIVELRQELAARDGAGFDLRAFHDELLGHGSLPLATLRRQLPAWVRPRPEAAQV